MGTHPNTLLICRMTPDGTSRKTMRAILTASGEKEDSDDLKIGGKRYNAIVMESNYDEAYQIPGKEGDLLFFQFLTYGYGETKPWAHVLRQQQALEAWASKHAATVGCSYVIEVGANYW